MRSKIAGRFWKRRVVSRLVDEGHPLDGDCLHDERTIRIVGGMPERAELETDIHEVLHALYPFLTEEAVKQGGRDLTAWLFDGLGYRKRQA